MGDPLMRSNLMISQSASLGERQNDCLEDSHPWETVPILVCPRARFARPFDRLAWSKRKKGSCIFRDTRVVARTTYAVAIYFLSSLSQRQNTNRNVDLICLLFSNWYHRCETVYIYHCCWILLITNKMFCLSLNCHFNSMICMINDSNCKNILVVYKCIISNKHFATCVYIFRLVSNFIGL